MEFVEYPSTPDFFKFTNPTYTKPTKGTSFIGTVKLHGTNASILCRSSPTLIFQYQSRNKVISTLPGDDNAGTAAFLSALPMSTIINEILRIRQVETFEEIFIAGEWAGTGIQTGVAVAHLERFFAIFNIQVDGHWVDIRDYNTVHLPRHRVYNIANFKTYEVDFDLNDAADCGKAYDLMKEYTLEVANLCPVAKDLLELEGAKVILKKGAPQVFGGEGIVWTIVPTPEYDAQLFNFKTKADQFLPVNAKASKRPPPTNATDSEKVAAFVDYVLGKYTLSMNCGASVYTYYRGDKDGARHRVFARNGH
jgi:RNA ligase